MEIWNIVDLGNNVDQCSLNGGSGFHTMSSKLVLDEEFHGSS